MPRGGRGKAEMEQLIARSELEPVTGAAADGDLCSTRHEGQPPRPRHWSPATRTAPTSWPMTPHGSPASHCCPARKSRNGRSQTHCPPLARGGCSTFAREVRRERMPGKVPGELAGVASPPRLARAARIARVLQGRDFTGLTVG